MEKKINFCPACGDSKKVSLAVKNLKFNNLRLSVLRCSACDHRWMPTTSDQQRVIEANYHKNYDCFKEDEYLNRILDQEIEQRISTILCSSSRILDVGCGNGVFLSRIKKRTWESSGIDISKAAIDICKNSGIEAVLGDFALQYNYAVKQYEMITMWDVLEHLRSPLSYLSKAYELLNEEGYLVLKIPSYGALNFKLLKVLSRRAPSLLGAPDHVQYFSRSSLSVLLSKSGFKQIFWMENKEFRSKPPTRSVKRRLSRVFQRQISNLALNENLYVYVPKKIKPESTALKLGAMEVTYL
jgi:2-polyprenyl-3-methyl-5-hydroxy-6-metoxy-1,4-benzoquinol methylase